MLTQENFQLKRHYGRVTPLKYGYYRNPQVCMFGFTLILTIFLSMVMILYVFTTFYHRCIGIILCLYITYRFFSLGLSNPGLAVQSIQEQSNSENQSQNENRMIQDNILIQNSQTQKHQLALQSRENIEEKNHAHQMQQNFYSQRNVYNFCNKCKIPVKRYTKHCQICRTCIEQFDHHCIWIGKCIGKKNMWQFKQFLCFTFGTLIYALVVSLQMTKIDHIQK